MRAAKLPAFVLVAVMIAISIGTTALPASAAGPTILGVGSSFVQNEVEQWRADVKRQFDINVNYNALGSTAGRQQFIDEQGDFATSDTQFLPAQLPQVKRQFVYVPVSAGGIAFMYNLKGTNGQRVSDLKLTPETVCKILAGQITKWDDPAITGPTGHALPATTITPVHRADGAGTSYVLGQYCIEQTPAVYAKLLDDYDATHKGFETVRPIPDTWPRINGFSADGSNNVADAVAAPDGDGRITAVEFSFAKIRRIPAASVRNASGVYTQPTEANVTRALRYAEVRPNGTHQLHFNGSGDDVYFPSTYSYAIVQTTGGDPAKGKVVADFLNYAVTKGQEKANVLGYAALSANLVTAALDAIVKIPGAPPRPDDVTFNVLDPGAGTGGGGGGTGGGSGSPDLPAGGGGGESGGGSGGTGGTNLPAGGGTTAPKAGATPKPGATPPAANRSTVRTPAAGAGAGAGRPVGSAVGGEAAAGLDPSVDLGVGTYGVTGGGHGIEAAIGAGMVVAGEAIRRRARRRHDRGAWA